MNLLLKRNVKIKIRLKKETLECCAWSIYFFCVIFSPPIVPHLKLILSAVSLFILLINFRESAIYVFKNSGIQGWICSFFFAFFILFAIALPISILKNDIVDSQHYIHILNRYGVLIVVVSICTTMILVWMEKKEKDSDFFFKILIYAGVIEGLCSILALLSPQIKDLFVSLMGFNTGTNRDEYFVSVRAYGFADSLVDTFGYGIAILSGVAFFFGILKNKKKFILMSGIIAVATLLNARTGVLLLAIGLLFFFFFLLVKKKTISLFRILIAILFVIVVAVILVWYLSEHYPNTIEWLESGFRGLINIFVKRDLRAGDGGLNTLFSSEFWNLPDDYRVVFGSGHTLFLAEGYAHSDVGYINELWLFGIVGCAIIYGFIIYQCLYICKNTNIILYQSIALYCLVSFFVFNIKGSAYGGNPGSQSVFILLFSLRYFTQRSKTKKLV